MGSRSQHLAVTIAVPAATAYDFAADPRNLPRWAAGLAGTSVEPDGDQWTTDSPMGPIRFRFAPANNLGVLDHDVTLPDGEVVHNPLRVVPDGEDACEVVFTLRQRRGMTDDEFARDAEAVARDLATLRTLLEAS